MLPGNYLPDLENVGAGGPGAPAPPPELTASVSFVACGSSGAWDTQIGATVGADYGSLPVLAMDAAVSVPPATLAIAGGVVTGQFNFITQPAGWPTDTTVNFTVFWIDANGNQQYVFGLTPTSVSVAGPYTVTFTSVTGLGYSATTLASIAGAIDVTLAPETVSALYIDGTTNLATSITAMAVTSTRVGLVVFKTNDGSPVYQPVLVGPTSGYLWVGAPGTSIIAARSTNATSSFVTISTADTELAVAPVIMLLAPQ